MPEEQKQTTVKLCFWSRVISFDSRFIGCTFKMAAIDHVGLLSNLEAALDVTKMMAVFGQFVGILKDQQSRIEELDTRLQQVQIPAPVIQQIIQQAPNSERQEIVMPVVDETLEPRIKELEKKVEEIELFTKGGGFSDDSVLHNTLEVSPFVAFRQANLLGGGGYNDDQYEPEKEEPIIPSKKPSPRPITPKQPEVVERVPSVEIDAVYERLQRLEKMLEEKEQQQKNQPEPIPEPAEEPTEEEEEEEEQKEEIVAVEPELEPEPEPEPEPEEVEQQQEEEHQEEQEQEEEEQEILRVPTIEELEQVFSKKILEPVIQFEEEVQMEPEIKQQFPQLAVVIPEAISNEISRSADELEIGEIKELPDIRRSQKNSMELSQALPLDIQGGGGGTHSQEPTPRSGRRSRERAIPDFKPGTPSAASVIGADSSSMPITRRSAMVRPSESSHYRSDSKKITPRLSDASKVLKLTHLARRKMDRKNLPWLTPQRSRKLIFDLTMRGRFMRISREMLEEQRKKYSAQSLKQKIDYLDAELNRISSKLDKLKDNTKKNNISIKEGFSFIKQQNDNFQSQLNALEEDLQALVYKKKNAPVPVANPSGGIPSVEGVDPEEIQRLLTNAAGLNELLLIVHNKGGHPLFEKLLHTNSKSRMLTADNLDEEGIIAHLSNHIKMNVLGPELHQIHNEFTNYHHKFNDILAEAFTKNDCNNMLKPSTESSTNLDSNHMKIMNLINKSIISTQERLEKVFDEKLKKIFASSFLLNSMGDKDGNNKGGMLMNEMMEKQLKEVTEQFDRLESDSQLKIHRMEEDILFMKDQFHQMEVNRLEQLTEIARLDKARQVEGEQLKILQKRIANLSVDKVSQ
jgi:hypothetical protein